MSTAGLINRYVWFVTTIYNRGPITLEEIQHRFESHFGRGEELSERQFHRYSNSGASSLFALILRKRISRTTPQTYGVIRLIYNILSQLLAKWQLLLALLLMFFLLHTLCC